MDESASDTPTEPVLNNAMEFGEAIFPDTAVNQPATEDDEEDEGITAEDMLEDEDPELDMLDQEAFAADHEQCLESFARALDLPFVPALDLLYELCNPEEESVEIVVNRVTEGPPSKRRRLPDGAYSALVDSDSDSYDDPEDSDFEPSDSSSDSEASESAEGSDYSEGDCLSGVVPAFKEWLSSEENAQYARNCQAITTDLPGMCDECQGAIREASELEWAELLFEMTQ